MRAVWVLLLWTGMMLGGCLTVDDEANGRVLYLEDLLECDYWFDESFVACEDTASVTGVVEGAPPTGTVCSFSMAAVNEHMVGLRLLWDVATERLGVHFLPGEMLLARDTPFVYGFTYSAGAEVHRHHWTFPAAEGHVFFDERVDRNSVLSGLMIGFTAHSVYWADATAPLDGGTLWLHWHEQDGRAHSTLLVEAEGSVYHLPMWMAVRGDMAHVHPGGLMVHDGLDFNVDLFVPEFFSTYDQATGMPLDQCVLPE
jgi:hypothetical protein